MKRLLLAVSIVCLLTVGYTTVHGAEWVYYSTSLDGKFYYDKESITSGGKGIIKVWGKIVYSEKGKEDYIQFAKEKSFYSKRFENINYSLNLNIINCTTREFNVSSSTKRDEIGDIIDSASSNIPSWAPIPPESTVEPLYKIVCKGKKK